MRHSTFWVILHLFAVPLLSAQVDTKPFVSGHVYYEDGKPVQGAEVEFHSYAGRSGIVQPPAPTDPTGYFTITKPDLGEGVVTASKVSEGFPNAALALYGRTGYESLKHIEVTQETHISGVVLRFLRPQTVLDLAIRDASTDKSISNARVLIQWPDEPEAMSSSGVDADGKWSFVLPRHEVLVRVTSPGYATWEMRYRSEAPKSRESVEKPVTVRLRGTR